MGNIALDDIVILNGPCPPQGQISIASFYLYIFYTEMSNNEIYT